MKFKLIYRANRMLLFVLIILHTNTLSQTNEVGIFMGGSLFKGDVGSHSKEKILLNSKPAFGLQVKRNFNYHFGVSFHVNRGELAANDKHSYDVFELERNLQFKSTITEFGLMFEFNFRPYMSRDAEYNYSPFIFAGVTKFFFNPKGYYTDGNWYSLRPLGTEGQGSDFYPQRELYDLKGVSIPFGVGYKINVYEFLTLSLNISWRITFTDYLDDVSTTYIDPTTMGDLNADLADQSENKFDVGFQRGNPNNNDKYGFIGMHILYSIKDPQKGCDNIVY
tara:strand:+ start:226 stop:1062 length:837 start_codon:yes stop_codon:yes gene_type:complete